MANGSASGSYTGHPYPSSPATGSGHQGRPTSFPPPPLTLSELRYTGQPPLTPHSNTMTGFTTAPLAPPQEYQVPQMSAPADAISFGSTYLSRTGSAQSNNASNTARHGQQELDRPSRLSLGGDFGHQRKRSLSHPPAAAYAQPVREA